ncbi:MAG: hypothetical protein AAF646_15405 [Pseudomonadota bacterium]
MPIAHGPFVTALALGLVLGLSAGAETLTEREARSQVAAPRMAVIVADLDFLDRAAKRQLEQAAEQFPYYGALVLSPGDPPENQSGLSVANHHSPEAAAEAALSACNARRTTGAPCVIVAQTVPRNYAPGVLTLSATATEALRGDFRRLDSPKAFAISNETGHFAFARGDGSRALANCNAAASEDSVAPCQIVVADP